MTIDSELDTRVLPALDLSRLRGFLDERMPGLVRGALVARLITGGRSNLTFDVTDGYSRWVLRRPPLGYVSATAHDMGREFRVMGALAGSAVPVPVVQCADSEVLGAPFYLMSKERGKTYRYARQLISLGGERTREISERLVDALVDVHAVDYVAVGLGDFGRPRGYLARQVERWRLQWDASTLRDVPGMGELHRRLEDAVPAESAATIVHGDFRLDNLLFGGQDRVGAVVGFERIGVLSEPLVDAGLAAFEEV
ncbi:phosphotransferase family protein [Nocardia sp. NPDC051570]|uniref:phosphotransferase family protein n=1 Tax=Nocardia sp. NPDC051570 TaxID=3364324 RepID=UPI00378F9E8C